MRDFGYFILITIVFKSSILSVFSYVFFSIEKKHQTLKTLFDQISKRPWSERTHPPYMGLLQRYNFSVWSNKTPVCPIWIIISSFHFYFNNLNLTIFFLYLYNLHLATLMETGCITYNKIHCKCITLQIHYIIIKFRKNISLLKSDK